MPFWNDALSEPKRAHRFILEIPGLTSTEGTKFTYAKYLAKSVTTPAYTVTEATHKFLGNTYYYPGSVEWNSVTAVIVNAINPDANQILLQALAGMGYLPPNVQEQIVSGNQAPGTVNKADALRQLGDISIEQVDGEGGTVGTWFLMNPFITNATFGDLNYDNDTELLNVTVQIRYDYAVYTSGGLAVERAGGTPGGQQ
jgi:hypothetical protein